MVEVSLGSFRGASWPPLAVEGRATRTETAKSAEVIRLDHGVCSGDASQGRCRALCGEMRSESYLLGAESQFDEEKNDSGPLQAKPEHTLSDFPDDLRDQGTSGGTSRRLPNLYRPRRCLLACANRKLLPKISGFFGKRGDVRVQGHALRTQRSPSGVHKVVSSVGRLSKATGVDGICVPRRLADCSSISSGVGQCHPGRLTSPSIRRLHCELGKVHSSSHSDHQVAGVDLGHAIGTFDLPTGQTVLAKRPSKAVRKAVPLYKATVRKISGQIKFCLPPRPRGKSQTKGTELFSDQLGEKILQGHAGAHVPKTRTQLATLDWHASDLPGKALCGPSSDGQSRIRRLRPRLGISDVPRSHGTRKMVSPGRLLSHQHPRVLGSVPSPEGSPVVERLLTAASLRQHDSSQLSEERGFVQVPCSQRLDPSGDLLGGKKGLVPPASPHQGVTQCVGRHPVAPETDLDGVVSGRGLLQLDVAPTGGSMSRDRPLCHAMECETAGVHSPGSGGFRDRHGRPVSPLGSVESSLPLSSVAFTFEGFTENRGIPRSSAVGSPVLAQEPLVPEAGQPLQLLPEVPQPGSLPGCGEQDALRSSLLDESVTRMDFLALNYNIIYKREIPTYLMSHLRPSSYRQYESVWRKFRDFARSLQPFLLIASWLCFFLLIYL